MIVPLKRGELPRGTAELARFLIGRAVVAEHDGIRQIGRIVECEAYPPGDPAGHAYNGRTTRNAALFLDRGHAYVYRAYGIHWLLNVTSEELGVGAGVLIRALDALEGIAAPTDGPGKLTKALGIDRRFDGVDLCAPGSLWLGSLDRAIGAIVTSPRIGISKARESPLRFLERKRP